MMKMYKKLVSTANMSQEKWLEWRRMGIGGSDASIICGINKYKSGIELWMEKLGLSEAQPAGEAAYWGTIMEPLIRDEFTKQTGLEVRLEKFMLQNEKYPFMLANVDGIIECPEYGACIFEAKTANVFKTTEWDDRIPDEYLLQIQHYMAVTGYKATYIAVLIGGNQFKWELVLRDEEIIKMLIKLEQDFWQHVTNNTPPPLDGSDASTQLLNSSFPEGMKGSSKQLPPEALELIEKFETNQEAEKEAAANKDMAANQLKCLLGNYETGYIENRIVAWRTVNTERFDSKQLNADNPEIYSKYTVPSRFRRFSVK
jgi:putative phage-type endonuclease